MLDLRWHSATGPVSAMGLRAWGLVSCGLVSCGPGPCGCGGAGVSEIEIQVTFEDRVDWGLRGGGPACLSISMARPARSCQRHRSKVGQQASADCPRWRSKPVAYRACFAASRSEVECTAPRPPAISSILCHSSSCLDAGSSSKALSRPGTAPGTPIACRHSVRCH
jgi:hypothetical protein